MATKKQNPLYNTWTWVVWTIKGGTSLGTNATKDSLISAANPTITPVVKPVVTNTVQNPTGTDVVNTPQNGTQNQKISSTTNDNTQKGITTPTTQNKPTFDLQKAQEAEAKLAAGQIQTLGQKTPEQKLQE